ncbi:MAG: DEAD/DEAH box helicase [Marmoricola sp.]
MVPREVSCDIVPPVVDRLLARPGRRGSLAHLEVVPRRTERTAEWPEWVHRDVVAAYRRSGIDRLWTHQREAAEAAYAGHHVVVATGTASGKSLAYLLPALSEITDRRGPRGQRGASVLYLSPTKALAHDQAANLQRLAVPGLRLGTHDGDAGREQRDWNRDHGEYLLSNPDMLHHSLLPGHERWSRFLGSLQYVVVDECHHYRGIFGAHVAQILRRLRRVCASYGAHPTFVLASATVADPAVAASRLTGLDVAAVTDDGSPHGELRLLLWEPPMTGTGGENHAPVRRSATAETADLVADLVVEGMRTIAFVPSRQGTEVVALSASRQLAEVDATLPGRVAAYRGGYLPEERRELEGALRRGELLALAATQALELGVDVSGLDAVVLAGFPGTRAALWQRLGRAGREGQDSLGVLVARDDPLDTYLVHHPEALVGRPVESFVFDPDNPHVLGPHLCAAAAEIPLTEADLDLFGPTAPEAVAALARAGLLRRRPRGWFWTDRRRASDLADLRSTGGTPVRLVEEGTGRVLGTVDPAAAHGTAHAGAVYVHQGETYLVTALDLDQAVASVVPAEPDYTTSARDVTDICVVSEGSHQEWPSARVSLGRVRVTHQVVSYLKRRQPGGEVVGEQPLDLPPRTLETTAVWWSLSTDALARSGLHEADLPGAAHAAEHASIGLLPLFATCDRWDIGGVSTAAHPDTGSLTVFVYDGHPGGAGFAERGYAAGPEWWRATREAIAACECADGCPSCVQSPKCGNQNQPLDKAGALTLLDLLLG